MGAVHPRPTSTFSPMAQSAPCWSKSRRTTRIPECPKEDIPKHQTGCFAEARRREAALISRGIIRSSPGNSETVGCGRSQRSSAVIPSEGPIGSKGSAIEGQDFVVRVVHRQGGATSQKSTRSWFSRRFLGRLKWTPSWRTVEPDCATSKRKWRWTCHQFLQIWAPSLLH